MTQERQKKTLVVNLFGSPGAGKSTGAAYIFSRLKMKGVNAELVTEYAKDKVWDKATEPFKNELYLFGKQQYKISRCASEVDVVVTDSPLPLCIAYNNDPVLGDLFNALVMNVFNSYSNMNYFVKRVKPYKQVGRLQSSEEADKISDEVLSVFLNHGIDFKEVDGDLAGYGEVIEDVLKELGLKEEGKIDDFSGEYFFLSNFFPSNLKYKGLEFTNTEAAFHAMKCPERAAEFCRLLPSEAKRLGRHVKLRPDWEQIKEQVMYEVCFAKFDQNPELKERLLETGNKELIEGNFWNDRCWGVCEGVGDNKLGKILMRLRDHFKNNKTTK